MACPDCGYVVGNYRCITSIETHGLDCGPYEAFTDEFIECGECGGRFDLREWDAAPEAAAAAQGDTGSGICDTPVASGAITAGGSV
jgi:uncharacterized CHY-type Zn-finger protein